MKRFILYFTITFGFLSCGLNDKKITQAEFERLFAQDSIESINLHNNDKVARIRIKPFSKKNKTYILPIESRETFQISFEKLRNKLDAQHIRPEYNMKISSSPEWPSYLHSLISLLLFFCGLILFLITVIDVLKNRFETATDKLIWILVIIFVPLIGPILYINIGRKQKLSDE